MSDLISRQAAIDAIKTWGLIDGLSEGQAIEILADEEKVPSVQPERKTGKWIDDGTEFGLCCSECEATFDDYFEGDQEEVQLRKIPKFCPNCGAKMEVEQYDAKTTCNKSV